MSPKQTRPPQPARPATREGLLLWVIHRFGEVFKQRAIVKGGMGLRLLDSPRHTNDVDLVLAPFDSKRKVLPEVEALLAGLDEAAVETSLHSQMIRAEIRLDAVNVQVEIAVAEHCPSIPMATAGLAAAQGVPSQVVCLMAPEVALAHKLAAWNERRLRRDLYDIYFLFARVGARPDRTVLDKRLAHYRSRIPALRRRRTMSLNELTAALSKTVTALNDEDLKAELAGLIEPEELAGLSLRLRGAINRLIESLEPTAGADGP